MKAYSYITRELYNEVKNNGRVYPKLGVSCYASSDNIYKAYEKRFEKQSFFAWNKDIGKDIIPQEGAEYVYVELDLPDNICRLTNYLNWCDLINVYMDSDEDPSDDELKETLEILGFKDFRTLEQLWEDIYAIDENDVNQVMYDYLDISFIKSAKGTNKTKKTY